MGSVQNSKPEPKRPWRLSRDPLLVRAGLASVALVVVMIASFAWPTNPADAPIVEAGQVGDFTIGRPVFFEEGDFFVVKLEPGEIIALVAQDPYADCPVTWMSHQPPHGPIIQWLGSCSGPFSVDGSSGPPARSLDRFAVEIRDGIVRVDTGVFFCGPPKPAEEICGP